MRVDRELSTQELLAVDDLKGGKKEAFYDNL